MYSAAAEKIPNGELEGILLDGGALRDVCIVVPYLGGDLLLWRRCSVAPLKCRNRVDRFAATGFLVWVRSPEQNAF
jgi:hypothetical protein